LDLCWPFCVVYRGLCCKLACCLSKDEGGFGLFEGSAAVPKPIAGGPAEPLNDAHLDESCTPSSLTMNREEDSAVNLTTKKD
jgi:hypothetical protein